jgi:hypothetical protein
MICEADVKLVSKTGAGMVVNAIEELAEAAGDDKDLGNMLLAMALGVALNTAARIDRGIALHAIDGFLHAIKDEP